MFKKVFANKWFQIIMAGLIGLFLYFLPQELGVQARTVLATFGIAGTLWLTEAVPLYETSFIIAGVLIFFGGFGTAEIYTSFADPIIFLFLGGFTMAQAFSKYKVDVYIANKMMRFFGKKPYQVMLGLMILSAFLSMWMSNTASTALLLPIGIQVLLNSGLKKEDPLFKAYPLAIAYAATTGGLATIIGSPPNALAIKYMGKSAMVEQTITFVDWMVQMLPVSILMLIAIFGVIKMLYRTEEKELVVKSKVKALGCKGKISLTVAVITALLWLTGKLTGLSSYLVAIIPMIVFFGTDLLDKEDLKELNWDTILLFGGGLALGEAVISSGVNEYIASGFEQFLVGLPIFILYALIVLIGIFFTVVASNTGAAVVMLPIVLSLAQKLGVDARLMVGLTTIGVSLDYILPVGTPPSAIAYSSGYIKSKEMIKTGLILTIFVVLVPTLVAIFLW
jgi:sodium-dependent dicarboxylate transporter 2/3/5